MRIPSWKQKNYMLQTETGTWGLHKGDDDNDERLGDRKYDGSNQVRKRHRLAKSDTNLGKRYIPIDKKVLRLLEQK